MAPYCEIDKEWPTSRQELLQFSRKSKNLDAARKNYPFKRTVSRAQLELIESLRKNYTKYAPRHNPEREIKVQRHQIRTFGLKSKNLIKSPTFVDGIYSSNSGVVVDFANKQLGGGFLTYGFAQEEVMFWERLDLGLYAAMMYAKNNPFHIRDNEALVIYGADKWVSLDFYGRVPDDWEQRSVFMPTGKPEPSSAIIAIDCLKATFKKYARGDLQWLLKKAYVGFQAVEVEFISTGNWGCGAFENNTNAILCLQTLAAALAGKHLYYHSTYERCQEGMELIKKWQKNNTSIKYAFDELVCICASDEKFFTSWDPRRRSTGLFEEKDAGGARKSRVSSSTTRTNGIAMRKTILKGEGVEYIPSTRSSCVSHPSLPADGSKRKRDVSRPSLPADGSKRKRDVSHPSLSADGSQRKRNVSHPSLPADGAQRKRNVSHPSLPADGVQKMVRWSNVLDARFPETADTMPLLQKLIDMKRSSRDTRRTTAGIYYTSEAARPSSSSRGENSRRSSSTRPRKRQSEVESRRVTLRSERRDSFRRMRPHVKGGLRQSG